MADDTRLLNVPQLSLVLLVGASGSGKSSFASRHFKATEVISSDDCRGLVSDDENSLEATAPAFEVLQFIASKRLEAGRLTVIDATNVQQSARKPLVALARTYHCLPVAIVLNLPESVCQERNNERPDRDFGPHVVRRQSQQLRKSLRGLKREGFRQIHVLDSVADVEKVQIERTPLWSDRRDEHGPFDIVGDIHGCYDELRQLLDTLGYDVQPSSEGDAPANSVTHPDGRRAVFVGDLVDRGPASNEVLRLVMDMVASEVAICVPGNHEAKLLRHLWGKKVKLTHGLAETVAQLEGESPEFRKRLQDFLYRIVSHAVLDDGKLVVAHAGLVESMHGRGSGRVRSFCLYGDTTGETDEFGLPIRYPWAEEYRGKAMVVYGHTPVPEAQWLNNTICIDTGCVFGGKLTALRYPERELVSVPAAKEYYEPVRPLAVEARGGTLGSQHQYDDLLDIRDVTGKRRIETWGNRTVTIEAEQNAAALEVASRFAVHPKWLVYLPPTMSPCSTSKQPGYLEHPQEALSYYRSRRVDRVVCEEKHMGSRAVVVICRDEDAVRERFGLAGHGIGKIMTRTGRAFFRDADMETALLQRLHAAFEGAGWWDRFETSWAVLDCELMPWSAKAQDLLRGQYAAVGAAARADLTLTVAELERANGNGVDLSEWLERTRQRAECAELYGAAYRGYCWPVNGVADLKLAPFHLLATEGAVHTDRDHMWHMATLAELCAAAPDVLHATAHRVVDLRDDDSVADAVNWWTELTDSGGEGMVVKPLDFIVEGRGKPVQPAVKCRGREYLRIIYGPDYTLPEHLSRLRERGLSRKRSLAMREFRLGIEALRRFVAHEPLRRVHECAFGVLALESEPVDPRL